MVPDGWQTKAFGACAELVRDTVSPENAVGLPYVGLEHIGEATLALAGHGHAEDVTSQKSRFRRGDILFGKLRPYFRKVVLAPFDGICSTDIWTVRAKPGTDQRFLFYWMASAEFVETATRASEGTRMPRAQWRFLERLEREVPGIDEQRAIAHILGSLDDKIELNRRMNETLEQIAQAIFKSWFVDFEPVKAKAAGRQPVGMDAATAALFPDSFEDSPLGKIPRGWRVEPLSDTIELQAGGTPRTDVPDYWNGDIPWISAKDVTAAGSIYITATERSITRAGVDRSSTRVLPRDTTVVTARGTVGACALTGREMAMNQTCYSARGKPDFGSLYTFFSLRQQIAALRQQTHGTIFDTITRSTFSGVPVVVPPPRLRHAFEAVARPMADLMLANQQQLATLAAIRDALLPRLMSGEIRVKDAERFLEPVR